MVKQTETEETTETKRERKAVAEHDLLDSQGQPFADDAKQVEEQAYGISYKLINHNKTFTWNWNDANEAERRMLAVFGAKTLATNETSAFRNDKKNSPTDYDGQYDALESRFADLRNGIWVDRTREPGAPRVNKDALATAICQVMVADGKAAAADIGEAGAGGLWDQRRARLDSDPAYMAGARANAKVADIYNTLVGKRTLSSDEL